MGGFEAPEVLLDTSARSAVPDFESADDYLRYFKAAAEFVGPSKDVAKLFTTSYASQSEINKLEKHKVRAGPRQLWLSAF